MSAIRLVSFLVLLAAPFAGARVIYVDRLLTTDCTANNYSFTSHTCSGSQGHAYSTLQKAANIVAAGDTVVIRGGRYAPFQLTARSGTSTAPITFRPQTGETAVIDRHLGGDSAWRAIEFFNGSSHIIIDGLEITDSDPRIDQHRSCDVIGQAQTCSDIFNQFFRSRNAIKFNNSATVHIEYVTIKNLFIHHYGGGGIAGKGYHLSILDNHIYNGGVIGEAYGMYLYGDSLIIRGNRSHDNIGHAIRLGTDPINGNAAAGYIINSIIEENILYDNLRPGIHYKNHSIPVTMKNGGSGLTIWHGHGNVVRNNLIYNNGVTGVWLNGDPPFNNQFYNNTICSNGRGGIYVYSEGETNVFRNNIAVGNGTLYGQLGLRAGNNLQSNNLTSDSLSAAGFVNAAARDFRLRADSPARDRGMTLGAVLTDIAGVQRPSGAYDIGAYEYVTGGRKPKSPSNLFVR